MCISYDERERLWKKLYETFNIDSLDHDGIVVLMPFGSRLYGTDTPLSDYDFKGVFHPTKEQMILGKVPRSFKFSTKKENNEKNTQNDVEVELFSVHEFLRLATEGQTVALDMLHANPNMLLLSSKSWELLQDRASMFYTKNLKAFIGYAKRQAAKYGIKGSRLHTAEKFLHLLELRPEAKIRELLSQNIFTDPTDSKKRVLFYEHFDGTKWQETVEHTVIHFGNGISDPLLEVLGKKLTFNATVSTYIPTFRKYLESYGERAKQAQNNENIDWKAMSHAIRAAIQLEYLFKYRTFSLPLPLEDRNYVKDIKCGIMPFVKIQEDLENRISRVNELASESSLPDRVDTKAVDRLILNWYLYGSRYD